MPIIGFLPNLSTQMRRSFAPQITIPAESPGMPQTPSGSQLAKMKKPKLCPKRESLLWVSITKFHFEPRDQNSSIPLGSRGQTIPMSGSGLKNGLEERRNLIFFKESASHSAGERRGGDLAGHLEKSVDPLHA